MTEFSIRPMRTADIDAVMTIAAGLEDAPHWPRSAYDTALDPAAVPRRIALVTETAGAIAGFAIASLIPPQAELETIAVSQSLVRRKAGSALFAALANELKSLQIIEIMLEVRASNVAAQAFYRAQGLAWYGARKGYYGGEDAVLMRGFIFGREK
jgi:ribosomal-protein-alanine N-acetyltransferase